MILGLACLLAANAGVTLASAAAARRLAGLSPEERFLSFLLLRVAFVMALALLFGLAGLLRPLPLGLAGAALLALGLLRGEHRGLPWPRRRPEGVPFALLLLAGLFAVRGLFHVWFLAPMSGDVLSYHLTPMAEWIQSGRIPGEVGNDPRSWFPAGYQLLEAWWVVFLKHDVLIEMAGMESLLLLFAAILALARRLGLGNREAWLAALLGATTPAAIMQSFSCYNDLPAAALVAAMTALLVARAPLSLLLLTAGLAAGLKPTALYAAPGLALLAWGLRAEPKAPAPSRALGVSFVALALFIGGFWYARNWAERGNPLYPMGSGAFERLWNEESQQLGARSESFVKNLSFLADERLSDFRRPYHPTLAYMAGWGIGLVSLGMPALVYAAMTHARFRLLAASLGLSLAVVLALVTPDPYNMRFVMFFTALPALGAGLLAARLPRLLYPAVAALALTWVTTMFPSSPELASLAKEYVFKSWRERWAAGYGYGEYTPKPPLVATWGGGGSFGYQFYRPDFSIRVRHLKAADADGLRRELAAAGVSRFYAFSIANSKSEKAVIDQGLREGWLRMPRDGVFDFAEGGFKR